MDQAMGLEFSSQYKSPQELGISKMKPDHVSSQELALQQQQHQNQVRHTDAHGRPGSLTVQQNPPQGYNQQQNINNGVLPPGYTHIDQVNPDPYIHQNNVQQANIHHDNRVTQNNIGVHPPTHQQHPSPNQQHRASNRTSNVNSMISPARPSQPPPAPPPILGGNQSPSSRNSLPPPPPPPEGQNSYPPSPLSTPQPVRQSGYPDPHRDSPVRNAYTSPRPDPNELPPPPPSPPPSLSNTPGSLPPPPSPPPIMGVATPPAAAPPPPPPPPPPSMMQSPERVMYRAPDAVSVSSDASSLTNGSTGAVPDPPPGTGRCALLEEIRNKECTYTGYQTSLVFVLLSFDKSVL